MSDVNLLNALIESTDSELAKIEKIATMTKEIKRIYVRKSLEEKLMLFKSNYLDEKQAAINKLSELSN